MSKTANNAPEPDVVDGPDAFACCDGTGACPHEVDVDARVRALAGRESLTADEVDQLPGLLAAVGRATSGITMLEAVALLLQHLDQKAVSSRGAL